MKYGSALLADSHLNVLAGVRSILEELFNVVVMVADEASLRSAAAKIVPDVVVVDLSLPVVGNCNIVRQFRSQYSDIKVIFLSVHDEPTVVNAVRAAGVVGFVLKRTAATDLGEAVRTVLEGGSYVSPSLFAK